MIQANWEEVERVLAAVLDLPEEQRAAYLARQPAPIRAEVESLLEAYRGAGSFLGSETGNPIAAAEMLGKMKLAFAGTRRHSELRGDRLRLTRVCSSVRIESSR